jgi:large subunit ribosomal protein L17
MRHLKVGRKLSRRREHRVSLLANLAVSLVKNGSLHTTDAKAKEMRPLVERMITFAKRGDLHARRIVRSRLRDADAVKKLFDEIGPKFKDRPGGYTRVLKLGYRHGDNSPVSLIEFVGEEKEKKVVRKVKTTEKKAVKKTGAAPAASKSGSKKKSVFKETVETTK